MGVHSLALMFAKSLANLIATEIATGCFRLLKKPLWLKERIEINTIWTWGRLVCHTLRITKSLQVKGNNKLWMIHVMILFVTKFNFRFRIVWTIQNTGADRWPANTRAVFLAGHYLSQVSSIPVDAIAPGEFCKVTVQLESPRPEEIQKAVFLKFKF